jgi:PAS domain S-box-containing protein
MDLRKKTVIILCVTIVSLLFALFILSDVVVLAGFSQVELHSAEKDTRRVLIALGDDLNTLDAVAHDWASQENTRTFLQEIEPGKSWSQLDTNTFERLQFNYIILTDAEGTVIAGKGYDLDNHRDTSIPAHLITLLTTNPVIRGQIRSDTSAIGILQFPEGPLMMAIRPVFSTQDRQQVTGYLLMARYLDAAEVSRLSSMAQLPVEIYPYNTPDILPGLEKPDAQFPGTGTPFILREGKEALAINAPIIIEPLDNDTLGTYSLIRDLFGQPVLVMKVRIDRDIYEKGKSTTLYFVVLLIVAGLAFGLVTLLLLEKTVISRILYLSRRVNKIGKDRDFSDRVELAGKDEIEGLATNVNEMLGELETSQQHLRNRLVQSEEKYRLIFNSISDPVIIYRYDATKDVPGVIIEVNDAAIHLLGHSRDALLSMPPSAVFTTGGESNFDDLDVPRLPPSEEVIQFESHFRNKRGDLIPIEVNARIFDQLGQIAVLTISRDITERKMAEGALRKANKKLNFLNFVTFNDIQNAVFALSGFTQIIHNSVHDDKIQKYFEKENESVNRITRALTIAKSYEDLGIKPPRWQNVSHVFSLAISHLNTSHLKRNVQVRGVEIFADPLLETVFFNLVKNVLEHASSATTITFRYDISTTGLTLVFEDDGKGVPPELKDRIFQRTPAGKKSMGLFLAREILEITGIHIVETGIYGKGARFELLIPKKAYRIVKQE